MEEGQTKQQIVGSLDMSRSLRQTKETGTVGPKVAVLNRKVSPLEHVFACCCLFSASAWIFC